MENEDVYEFVIGLERKQAGSGDVERAERGESVTETGVVIGHVSCVSFCLSPLVSLSLSCYFSRSLLEVEMVQGSVIGEESHFVRLSVYSSVFFSLSPLLSVSSPKLGVERP